MDDRPKRKRNNWSEADEIRLLGIWEENINELKKCRRNSHIYKRMAEHFSGHTPGEVHIKISNFTQRYRAEKKSAETPGAGPSSWKYFAIVDRILGPMKNGDNQDDGDNDESRDFEEMPEHFTFKEEASSGATSYSSSPAPFMPLVPPPIDLASIPARLQSLFPASMLGSQDSQASSPRPSTKPSSGDRKRNRATLQKEALVIARENQSLLREQIAFSREAVKEQLSMIAHSIELIKESTENSKIFSKRICEISERQLELENSFMGFMKEILSKKVKRKRK